MARRRFDGVLRVRIGVGPVSLGWPGALDRGELTEAIPISSHKTGLGDFQGVILAGGLGTRMRPATKTIPKPMIPVAGKPFLQHQIELLGAAGIRRVLLLISYLGEQIEQYFGPSFGCELAYSREASPLGTGGALKNAAGKLDDEFMVLNGDTYLAIDYRAFIRAFRDSQSPAFIVAYGKPGPAFGGTPASQVTNNLAVTPEGRVTAYRKHDPAGLTHVDAGVIALRKEVIDRIPAGRKCSLEEEIFPSLICENRMRAWTTTEPFYDMGSPAGLAALAGKLG